MMPFSSRNFAVLYYWSQFCKSYFGLELCWQMSHYLTGTRPRLACEFAVMSLCSRVFAVSRAVMLSEDITRQARPLFSPFVRWRKRRWAPKAPSKEFYIREKPVQDPEEYAELKERYRLYRTYCKSLRYHFVPCSEQAPCCGVFQRHFPAMTSASKPEMPSRLGCLVWVKKQNKTKQEPRQWDKQSHRSLDVLIFRQYLRERIWKEQMHMESAEVEQAADDAWHGCLEINDEWNETTRKIR